MYGITDLKVGTTFAYEGNPYVVLDSQHSKMGRGGAILRAKIKNILSGVIIEKTFRDSDKFEPVSIERRDAQFLYSEGDSYFFMDQTTFDQFSLDEKSVAEANKYLIEGSIFQIHFYESKPIKIELPIKMVFAVVQAEKGLKGDTATAATKPVKIETGVTVNVPIFVKEGDKIRVDTRNGSYVERVKS